MVCPAHETGGPLARLLRNTRMKLEEGCIAIANDAHPGVEDLRNDELQIAGLLLQAEALARRSDARRRQLRLEPVTANDQY
jgi:hypothetical protein